MIKNALAALIAATALAGVAVPALAASAEPVREASEADTAFGSGTPEMRQFIADSVLAELRQRGINATAVEDWSGLIRAYVTLDDGSQVMQFYAPGSLQQVFF